ncbi:asparagine synthase (glutamine-hydrolyzing) [Patescibacteria group bacterium]|nr:asparagine synthase (glutamine-hydrolyzing) [Patescibacteria group bacterium]
MCGINGIIKFDKEEVSRDEIALMNKKIIHRGPDDSGVFTDNCVGLGHVRLSVIDLSPKGHQPMVYEHKGRKFVITYNGEIYNFQELRENLKKKGYRFNSNTDTEIVLASYIEYGPNCLKYFNGMFAFVIYDLDRQIMFGGRDRFGQKPLKYYINNNQFIFSSELKAILTNNVPKEVDYDAIDDFLTLQFVPAPKTGFKNIHKLPAAHYFTLDLKSQDLKVRRYFDLDYSKKQERSKKEWIKLVERELEKAIKKRLISDVPLGAFLSGGIDSSAVVALMSKHSKKVKTFSIKFEQKEYDESKQARAVAKLYQTDHTEFKVQSKDLLKYIESLVIQFEEPYADSSALPTFILSKLTRKHVTVALSGDAGDENFGGYEKYQNHLAIIKYKWLFNLLKNFSPLINNERLNILFKILNKSIGRKHYNFTSYFDEFSKQELYQDDFADRLTKNENVFEKIIQSKNFTDIDKVFYLDFNSYIPDDLNVKVDLASMLSALEVRSPFLDYELVSRMAQMPSGLKTDARHGKIILKKMLRKYLPSSILNKKKHGFSVPLKYWFRNELKDYVKNNILDNQGLVAKITKKEKVEELIKEHNRGQDNSRKIWTLMVLNLWYKQNFSQ